MGTVRPQTPNKGLKPLDPLFLWGGFFCALHGKIFVGDGEFCFCFCFVFLREMEFHPKPHKGLEPLDPLFLWGGFFVLCMGMFFRGGRSGSLFCCGGFLVGIGFVVLIGAV